MPATGALAVNGWAKSWGCVFLRAILAMALRTAIRALTQAFHSPPQTGPAVGPDLDAKMRLALEHHGAGRRMEAEQLYKEVIRANHNHADAIHMLGVIAHQANKQQIAQDLVLEAIGLKPLEPAYHSNLGAIYVSLGNYELAAGSFHRALELDVEFTAARTNLAGVLEYLGRYEEAAALYRRELEVRPGPQHPMLVRGISQFDAGQFPEALATFRDGCRVDVEASKSHLQAGLVLANAENFQAAQDEFTESVNLNPGNDRAMIELGLALAALEDYSGATKIYQDRNRLFRTPGIKSDLADPTFSQTSPAKLQHDIEQLIYLREHGILTAAVDDQITESRAILASYNPTPGNEDPIQLENLASPAFRSRYNRLLHYRPTPTLDGSSLSEHLDADDIQDRYFAGNRITYFDDMLSASALAELRAFCLESTIWYQIEYSAEVGASSPQGFSCPLLFQIGDDLRARMSRVFDGLYFRGCWAYRYYGEHSGLREHIDNATVSVNLWLTPDSANENPANGGLVYWNKRGPEDFMSRSREENDSILAALLAEPDTIRQTIPYRCNRAVLFDSHTIHGTDMYSFRSGYENRRANVTFLFGPPGGAPERS